MLAPQTRKSILGAALAAIGLALAWIAFSSDAAEKPEGVLPPERSEGLAAAWDRLARIDFPGAYERFSELKATGQASEREANLGLAATLLNLPPKTQGKIDEAEALLKSVAEANPGDDTGLMAAIYHARIPHLHRREVRAAEAYDRYESVAEANPEHFLGQYARLKCALLDLVLGVGESAGSIDERVAYWEAKAAHVSHPILRRNLARLLGEMLIHEGGSLERAQAFAVESVEFEPSRYDIMKYWRMRAINLAIENEDWSAARPLLVDYLNAYPGTWRKHAQNLLAMVEGKLAKR